MMHIILDICAILDPVRKHCSQSIMICVTGKYDLFVDVIVYKKFW